MARNEHGWNPFTALENLFQALERMGGVHICVHDLRGWTLAEGQRQLPPPRYVHISPFCMQVKANPKGRGLCGQSDYHRANNRGLREKGWFLKRCHAGVWEGVFPLIRGGRVLGSVFCGVCTKPARRPAWPWAAHDRPALTALFEQLPSVAQRPLTEIGRTLEAAVPPLLDNILAFSGSRHDATRTRIFEWAAEHARHEPDIRDLARHLTLSPSRAAHVVKEHTGLSLGKLVCSLRMNEARNLLRFTDTRIGEIARRVGFPDSNYFSRVFAKDSGLSPREFRRQSLLT